MDEENYKFQIKQVGGKIKKEDRIRRLVPWFENGQVWMPKDGIWHTDADGNRRDMVQVFRSEEFGSFPSSIHDDMFDSLSRFCDIKYPMWPSLPHYGMEESMDYADNVGNWMTVCAHASHT